MNSLAPLSTPFLRALALLLAAASLATAQLDRANAVGRVSDPTGAVIQGARVTLTRPATNETHRATTTTTGDFSIIGLPADLYDIQVSSAGFSAAVQKGVRLEVGQTHRFDFQLKLGDTAETVDVTAEAPLLRTDAATAGTVVGNSVIVGLPLNSRSIVATLTRLTPGVIRRRGADETSVQTASQYSVRGSRYTDNYVSLDGAPLSFGNGGIVASVNPDAVEEFSIKTGVYGAEHGIRSGGQISVSLKSGTNQLHGTLFHYLRNDNLDARNFFAARRQEYKRNQFGGVLGGPVYLPKLIDGRNRLWFLFSYAGERVQQGQALTGVVPTPAERTGAFTAAITDPLSNTPFPNNALPASRLNPVSLKLLPLWPDPNTTGRGFNFTSPNSSLNRATNQYIGKLDLRVSDHDRWSGSVMLFDDPNVTVNAIPAFGRDDLQESWVSTINNTRTIGTRVVNDFRIGMLRLVQGRGATTAYSDFTRNLGIRNWPRKTADLYGLPAFAVVGYLPLGEQNQYGRVAYGDWTIRNSLSAVVGAHSIKTGYQWRRHHIWPMLDTRAAFNWQARYTRHAFADFLLGYLTNSTEASPSQRGRQGQNSQHIYFQDDWRVTSRLTLNLGLRYEYLGPWKDRRGFLANFDPATGKLFPDVVETPADPTREGKYVSNYPLVKQGNRNLMPRVGAAFQIGRGAVLHAGYAHYGNELSIGVLQQLGANPRPNASRITLNSDPRVPSLSIPDPFNVAVLPELPLPSLTTVDPVVPQMRARSWLFAYQQSLGATAMVKIGYQGSSTINDYIQVQANDATPGTGPRQPRRPYPNFQGISSIRAIGTGNYHGLELEFDKRPGASGFFYKVSLTWAKSMDVAGGRFASDGDPGAVSRNLPLSANRGRSEGDIPGLLAVAAGYELPFGKGKRYIAAGALGKVLGGWSLNSLVNWQAGQYVTAAMANDFLDVGSITSYRPDVLRNPNLPKSERTPGRWFDTGAFVRPDGLRYGNAGRSIIQSPGFFTLDAAILRNFTLRESLRLEFRFETFNLTNYANLRTPGNSFGTPAFGVVSAALEPRDLQFGFKLYF